MERDTGRHLFRAWLDYLGWGPVEAARRFRLDRTTIYRYLQGAGWTRHTQEKMAAAIGITPQEFLAGPPGWEFEGQYGRVADAAYSYRTQEGLVEIPLYRGIPDDFDRPPDDSYAITVQIARPGRVIIEVNDDSMAPRIEPGDLVIVDKEMTNPQSRQVVVVAVGEKRYLAQWLVQDRKVYLRWYNGRWPDLEVDRDQVMVMGTAVKIVAGEL